MPAISISGTNGKSTTTRMIANILRTAGRHVGVTTSDGVIVDDELVEEGDLTGPLGAQSVLRNPDVDVAVLETARGGILLRGLGYQSNDASVLTNVSPDHLDLQGLHTLPELAEVKSVIARVTKPEGVVVLNADDALVAAVGRQVKAAVCFFSLKPASARIRRHLAAGGRAMVVEDGWIVEAVGSRRNRIVAVGRRAGDDGRRRASQRGQRAGGGRRRDGTRRDAASRWPPACALSGRHRLRCPGGSTSTAWVTASCWSTSPTTRPACGSFSTRSMHSSASAEHRQATLSTIVGTAGDRPDDGLRAVGRLAGARSDQVAIKETLHYLRGRSRQSVIGELSAGLRESGVRLADVPIYGDEPSCAARAS